MRSILKLFFMASFLLFFLNGCGHYEPSFLDSAAGTQNENQDGTVDVNGVSDDVHSQSMVIKRVAFPASEYAGLKRSGNGTVKGTIAITYNGHTIPGRQTKLYLNPVTSYSNQWYRESYLGGHKMGKSDPRLFNYLKFTASNANGNFAFYGVAPGSYYVVGTVKCNDCGGKNIRIARKIRVGSSGTVTVQLNKAL